MNSSSTMMKEFSAIVQQMQEITDHARKLQQEFSEQLETLDREISERKKLKAELDNDAKQAQEIIDKVTKRSQKSNERVKLNVGGTVFHTNRDTLTNEPMSFFGGMFSGNFDIERDENGEVFIDRDPKHFDCILNHLRGVDVTHRIEEMSSVDRADMLQEVEHNQIQSLLHLFSELAQVGEEVEDQQEVRDGGSVLNKQLHAKNCRRLSRPM